MDIDRKNIGQLNSKSDYKRRLLIAILFGLGVLLFTLMTAFSDQASFFAFSGLALMAVSGVLAVFNSVHEGKKGSAVAIVAAAAVLGYLAGSYLIPVDNMSASSLKVVDQTVEQDAVASTGEPGTTQVGQYSFGSDLFSAESTVLQIAADLVPVEGAKAQDYVAEAKGMGYKPNSRASLDWGKVQVHEYHEQVLVSVPFRGREDLEIVNRVVFFLRGEGTQVSEVYMTILNEDTFKIRHWMNSKLLLNKVGTIDSNATKAGTEQETGVQNVGMDWKALNRCLNSQGVGAWALAGISLVCGGACAVTAGLGCAFCIGFATGFGGSFVEKCIRKAWT